MHTPEVVVHVEQRDLVHVVVEFLGEAIRQPSEPAHVHSHGQVLALDVARRDVLGVRIADNLHAFGAKTLRGAVALLAFRIVPNTLTSCA